MMGLNVGGLADLQGAEMVLDALGETGIAYLREADSFFERAEWEEIEGIVQSPLLPHERVVIGDAGERNNVRVGRFLTDVDRPERVNEPLASRLLDIIHSPAKATFYRRLLRAEAVTVRRAQVNTMSIGNYIGYHLDTDSNPDYGYSIVLQLGKGYAGGEFVAYDGDRPIFDAVPEHRSALITRSDIPHEVKTVQGGQRISLVYFISASSGDNRRPVEERVESVTADTPHAPAR